MGKEDRKLQISDFEHGLLINGMMAFRNQLLEEGKPTGLKHFGDWPTIYEGLSSLPAQVQKSWFGFDHYYSDHSFDEAFDIVTSISGLCCTHLNANRPVLPPISNRVLV